MVVPSRRSDKRSKTRSPTAGAGPLSRRLCPRCAPMIKRGGRPDSASSQSCGLAIKSPSRSLLVMVAISVGGMAPGFTKTLPRRATSPSVSSSLSSAFNAMRAAPLIPKALAISRLPTFCVWARGVFTDCEASSFDLLFFDSIGPWDKK